MSHSLTNPKVSTKNYFSEKKLKNCLSFEINNILAENEQLRQENQTLKSAIAEVNLKNKNLVDLVSENESKFEDGFKKLRLEIVSNKKQLLENNENYLEQQKKYLDETNTLKDENEKLKISKIEAETQHAENLKSLQSEIALLKLNQDKLKNETVEVSQKSSKYKLKLKHAIKIINELNNLVVHYNTKPISNSETTQTEVGSFLNCSLCSNSKTQMDLLSIENMLLDDIFFKPKPFHENDILLC